MRAYLSRRQSLTCSSGFTLIETALIIVILGFIIAALIKTIPVLIVQEQERQQEKNYDTVRAALSAFISQDADGNPATPELMSRYPCPAPLNAGPADATFALEQRNAGTGECISSTDGSNGVFRIEDGGGNPIAYIGAIPTRTLEISSEYMLDPFKNKLTYAVSANMVMDNALGLGLNGMLNIEDDSGITFTSQAQFALISHGKDGAGAYSIEGGQILPCRTTLNDGENCDFTTGTGNATFRESQVKLGNNTDFYDDRLFFSLVDDVDDEWWESVDGIEDIRNKNAGVVCIGDACDPSIATGNDIMIVDGSIRTVSSVRAAGHLESGLDTIVGRDLIAARDVLAGQDVSASQNVIAGDLLSAGVGLVVGGVTNPAGLGNNAAAIGNIDASTVGNGSLGVQNDITAGRDIFGRHITASGNGSFGGQVGIGTSSPIVALDVDGSIKIGDEDVACNNSTRGTMRYNADSGLMEYCSPGGWTSVGDATGGCSATTAGKVRHNLETDTQEYCDGENWVTVSGNMECRICASSSSGALIQGSGATVDRSSACTNYITVGTAGSISVSAPAVPGGFLGGLDLEISMDCRATDGDEICVGPKPVCGGNNNPFTQVVCSPNGTWVCTFKKDFKKVYP